MSPTDAGATPMQPGLSATAVLAIAVACVAIACITLLIPAAPSYDPWAWLVWGREVLRGDLQTVTGPSWKPLPVLFTAPFSLFGDAAPSLWLIVARAAHLGSAAVAAAVGFRLAGRFGALATGGLILVAPEFWPSVLLGNSEGILVLCVLGAFERHLAGRSGQAFALAVAAGLIRAEAWPFLLLYAAWLVVRDPSRLRWVAPGLALLPVLWLLPELWGSGSLSRGADRALKPDPSAPAFAAHPALRVMGNMVSLMSLASFTGLGCAAVMIGLRRAPRSAVGPVLGLAAVGVAWVGLVAVMTEFGFSGIYRYLVMPLAIAYVLAGIGYGWVFEVLLRARPRGLLPIGAAVTIALLGAIGLARGSLVWPKNVRFVERHGTVTANLDTAITRAGGERRLEACGSVSASFLLTPPVAWTLDRHLAQVAPVSRVPGVTLRARLIEGLPLEPPRAAVANASGRRTLARTKYWDVEAACNESASTQGP